MVSPLTGWTRAHWLAAADSLLEGVRPFVSPGGALVDLPGGPPSRQGVVYHQLEGFARTFLLACFRIVGTDGVGCDELIEGYARGLSAGTTAAHSESWPVMEDRSQSIVEAASVAIGLYETKPFIWNRLSDKTRDGLVQWLGSVTGKKCPSNNWLLFPVVVNAFLKSVGAPHSTRLIETNLDLIEKMYEGDGWYRDGLGRNFDHYCGWAMQFYTFYWSRIDGEQSDPPRARLYRDRLLRFLEDYRYLFGARGAPLHYGRSLIYRFAALAPFWAGEVCGATPLSPGETRRLASGCVQYFLAAGAVRDGILTMGWHDEYLPMTQPGFGPASPYWASKGFLGLVLPPTHKVWTDTEEPLPIERGDYRRAMPSPGFLVSGTSQDGIVRVSNNKADHYPHPTGSLDAYYSKLSYSTATAPTVGGESERLDHDSQVVLVDPKGSSSHRKSFTSTRITDVFACSVHYPTSWGPLEGTRVAKRLEKSLPIWLERRIPLLRLPAWRLLIGLERQLLRWAPYLCPIRIERIATFSFPLGVEELRINHVSTLRPKLLRDGGYAVAADEPPMDQRVNGWLILRGSGQLLSGIRGIVGMGEPRKLVLDKGNAFGRFAAVPYVESIEALKSEEIVASVNCLTCGTVNLPETSVENLTVRKGHVDFRVGHWHYRLDVGRGRQDVALAMTSSTAPE